jgi:hypothetical protein
MENVIIWNANLMNLEMKWAPHVMYSSLLAIVKALHEKQGFNKK